MTNMTKHTFTQFDTELDDLRRRVVMMGELVCQQVARAMDGLTGNDMALIDEVIDTDKVVNRKEIELDEICIQMIARHGPTASDLRLLMTIMQMITDLER